MLVSVVIMPNCPRPQLGALTRFYTLRLATVETISIITNCSELCGICNFLHNEYLAPSVKMDEILDRWGQPRGDISLDCFESKL